MTVTIDIHLIFMNMIFANVVEIQVALTFPVKEFPYFQIYLNKKFMHYLLQNAELSQVIIGISNIIFPFSFIILL